MENEAAEKNIIIVAGEASGDMHGASLVREMLKINPALRFYGIGGSKLKEAGVEIIADAAEIAVVGLTEAFSKLVNFLRVIRNLRRKINQLNPALVILIDFPDFNLNIAARFAKKRKIKVFYYISPQVWAWREGRINQIKKLVDKMAVILPFEVEVYSKRGFNVDYVGHPLLDAVKTRFSAREEAKKYFGLKENKITIGLLPGSRTAEAEKLLPEMLKAATIISETIPGAQYILPLAETLAEKQIAPMIYDSGIR